MTNVKYIIYTLISSALLLAVIGLWVGNKTGEVHLLGGSSGNTPGQVDGTPPGPLSVDETKNLPAPDNAKTTAQKPMASSTQNPIKNPIAVFHTTKGDIKLELFRDVMPITTGNFIKLVGEGFYNETKFHRVIAGFMIQGGDPNTKGTNSAIYGQGGPGYTIQDEFVDEPRLTNVRGTIAMANTGQPNSGGSQFFINLVDNKGLDFNKEPLSSKHPVFGRVVAGMDVVDAIGGVQKDNRDLPLEPIVIKSITIEGN